jgi:hypothetical protein
MKYNSKIDENQKSIVKQLRAVGCTVLLCHSLKNAFDILVGYKGVLYMMEIKNPKYLPKIYDRARLEKALSEGEKKCMDDFKKSDVTYYIVATIDEALKVINFKLF